MGVAGLWPVLEPVAVKRSLTHLAVVDGFEKNPNGMRGLRVGIDASIWLVHATNWVAKSTDGRDKGENPELRTILFKCTKLMQKPFLPLFVFDGPYRPDVKRGKHITKAPHWMVSALQSIFTSLGVEWRTAPGEAEAELAYLNRIGVIDVVLTDDVDTFLFGAKMVMRNCGATLSANRFNPILNELGRDDGNHTKTYHADDILHKITLTHGGLILVALLSGGDYHSGVFGCGPDIAVGLAKCGFGDSLLTAARQGIDSPHLADFLPSWRTEIREELRSNKHGYMKSRKPTLAGKFPDTFPDLGVLDMYVNPITSESKGKTAADIKLNWDKELDIGALAHVCERFFEWGYREAIIKRFRTIVWPYALLRIMRRAALLKDRGGTSSSIAGTRLGGMPSTPKKTVHVRAVCGTPSKMIRRHFSQAQGSDSEDESDPKFITKIHMQRRHPETDRLLEYRLEVAPAQLVKLAHAGIKDERAPPDMTGLSDWEDADNEDEDDEDGGGKGKTKKPPTHPDSHLRLWLPASIVSMVEPDIVQEFEEREAKKAEKKAGRGVKGKERAGSSVPPSPSKKRAPAKKKVVAIPEEDESGGDEPSVPLTLVPEKAKQKTTKGKTTAIPAAFPMSSPPPELQEISNTVSKPRAVDDVFKAKKPIRVGAIDGSFKAKKPLRGDAAASSSKVPDVAKLFVPGFDVFKDLTKKTEQTAPLRPSRSTSPSKPPGMWERTMSQGVSLSRTTSSSQQGSSQQSQATSMTAPSPSPSPSKARAKPKPFPMDVDFDWGLVPDAGPSTSTRTFVPPRPTPSRKEKQRRLRTPDSEPRGAEELVKSPRRSTAHGSPRKNRIASGSSSNLWDVSSSDDEGNERPDSPSPMRPPKKKTQHESKTSGTSRDRTKGKRAVVSVEIDVISISSDSDGAPPPLKKSVPKKVDLIDVIEISD